MGNLILKNNSCKINSKLENALFNLYWLQKEYIEISIEFGNNLTRFINKQISYSELDSRNNDLRLSIKGLNDAIDKYKQEMNYYITRRQHNEGKKKKGFSYRKINGVRIQNLRYISTDLFSKDLPKYCSKCGSKEKLHIHHLRYSYPPQLKDLVRLCAKCHSKLHSDLKQEKKNKLYSRVAMTPPLIADGDLK